MRRYEDISGQLGWIRLAVALAFVVLLWLSVFRGALTAWWLLAPALTFLALVAIHLNIREKRRRAVEGVAFYEDGLARIEDRWMGRKRGSYRFNDESHLYAPDLDIFGTGSLFELLSTARTRAGEETLAGWLTAPASQAEIQARQEAVEELRGRIDLREDLAVLGARHRLATKPERLARWATMPSVTHDLALAKVADALAPLASNVHFVDHVKDGQLVMDYRMRPGVVSRTNALELMRAVGLDVDGDHRRDAVPNPSEIDGG